MAGPGDWIWKKRRTKSGNSAAHSGIDCIAVSASSGAEQKTFYRDDSERTSGRRDEGTGTVCLWGQERGCAMVRVHNVRMIARMVKMMNVLMQRKM